MAEGEWSKAVAPIVAKCEVGCKFGDRVVFNRDGADALGKLLKTMAEKLDEANDETTEVYVLPAWVASH